MFWEFAESFHYFIRFSIDFRFKKKTFCSWYKIGLIKNLQYLAQITVTLSQEFCFVDIIIIIIYVKYIETKFLNLLKTIVNSNLPLELWIEGIVQSLSATKLKNVMHWDTTLNIIKSGFQFYISAIL